MNDADPKIVRGPGKNKWPGSPKAEGETVSDGAQAFVDDRSIAVENRSLPLVIKSKEPTARDVRQREILRLKVVSAVQMAALLFSEADIVSFVDEGLSNARHGSDRS